MGSLNSFRHLVMVRLKFPGGLFLLGISTITNFNFKWDIMGLIGESLAKVEDTGANDRYHSHVGFQLSTSQGPIIVDQKDWISPVEYDEDLVVMVQEYWHVCLLVLIPYKWLMPRRMTQRW